MASEFFINLNFVCNERCVFCAADLKYEKGRQRRWITLRELDRWLAEGPPGPGDSVMLAGGEPTVHPEFLQIVRRIRSTCPSVMVFTNGLRLAEGTFALDAVQAGVTWFEVALYGASARRHDGITQVPGSLPRTLRGLMRLGALRTAYPFRIVVRLLVSRQTYTQNPHIVALLHRRVWGVDAISLNRLILSRSARDEDAAVSWEEVRTSVNETAHRARRLGYEFRFEAVPFCVFDGDNAQYVREQMTRFALPPIVPRASPATDFRYFDPGVAQGGAASITSMAPLAMPAVCRVCDYRHVCGRVETWYVHRFGTAGLRSCRLEGSGSDSLRIR